MSKLITIPSTRDQIKDLVDITDAFLIGVEGLSVNLPVYFSFEELKEIIEYLNLHNKEVFINLNKNMHNADLEPLEKVMSELNTLDIAGIFYYDIAVINIHTRLGLKYDLVWGQEHLSTNYYTCNYWHSLGVKYALISSEITLEEINEIKQNSDMQLIVPIFGYLPMFVSRRHLVKNYLEYFSLQDTSLINYIEKEGHIYPVIDDNNGTGVYSANILNGLEESLLLKEQKIDYLLLNSFNIDKVEFESILSKFYHLKKENMEDFSKKIDMLLDKPTDKGFLYKETVYKVKNNG